MLIAKAKITDCQLEPTDETKLVVTVQNASPVATATDVQAIASLEPKCAKGIQLTPESLSFGTIPPKGKAVREYFIRTQDANPDSYKVLFNMKYNYEVPTHECDQEEFEVVKD